MNNKPMNIVVLSLILLVVFASSCVAANRINLVKNGTVTIETERTGKAYIASSNAYEENGDLVITGVLRRKDRVGTPIKTHVDAVISSTGAATSSNEVKVSRRIMRRGYKSYERFTIRFAGVPAKGSVVKLTSHSGNHAK